MAITWIKIDGEWRLVNTLSKSDGEWTPAGVAVRTDAGWEGAAWSTATPGGFTERYMHKLNNLVNEVLAPETDVEDEYPEDFGYVNPRPLVPCSTAQIPPLLMNSLHLAVIPKGPHRGKVLAMNGDVVTASSVTFFGNDKTWCFQGVSIIDFSKDAGTPEKPRFLNFLIPLNTSSYQLNYTVNPSFTDSVYPNFFCVGHAWSPSGDLILAGGSKWGFARDPDRQIYGIGRLYASELTYSWNPALPGSWTSSIDTGYGGFDSVQIPFQNTHYVSAGAWVRGPNLSEYRWYPTVLPYPRVSRTNNKNQFLVFGGDTAQRMGIDWDRIPNSFNSYESLIISSMTTSSNSGLVKDIYNGNYLFNGPSLENPNQAYSALTTTNQVIIDGSIFNDSLYFYPRCFTTSSNAVCFAGFTHRSSLLIDHSTNPGVWDNTVGNNITTPTARNTFRYYGSAFRVPNNLEQHRIDDIVRCGGGDTFNYDRALQDTTTADILKLSDIPGIPGADNYIEWSAYNFLNESRSTFNTVILPDATIFAVGGVQNDLESTLQLKQSYLDENNLATQVDMSPLVIADHHHQMGVMSPATTFEELAEDHAAHHLEEIYDVFPSESLNDPGNRAGGYRYLVCPEILDSNGQEWTLYDWIRTTSWRDYHSASLLLPDGRVLISGGEGRHAPNPWLLDPNNTLFPGLGVDYEIFSPKYIKPTQGLYDTTVRPTGVGVSGAIYNSHPQIDCPELNFNGQYIVSSNAFTNPSIYLERVVLMPPGNCTHHADITQRYYKCISEQINSTQLRFTMPSGENILPRGFYMLFAVTNEEIPAEAVWVWVN